MTAEFPRLLGSLLVLLAACGGQTLKTGGDAGISLDQSVASDLRLPQDPAHDSLVPPDLLPDSMTPGHDSGADAAPDRVNVPDQTMDIRPQDMASEGTLSDLPAAGQDLTADRPGLDLVVDTPSADVDIGEVQPFVVDGALATFCSGDSARMKVNGTETDLTVTGVQIGYDCCNGAEFQITSKDFGLPIVFTWRQKLGRDVKLPDTIDLANPPDNWSYYLYAGCNPSDSSCSGPSDYYSSGFEGMLSVAYNDNYRFDMSLCLHVEEVAGSSHTRLHSLDLYAPHVLTR
jgi:hypothetical protein